MKRASDFPPPFESLTMLIYGDGGTGKTHFAGTFGNDVLYINIGAGISTLYAPRFKSKWGEWNPYLFNVTKDDKDPFVSVCDAIDDCLDNAPDVHTIVIDDASTLGKMAMEKAIKLNFDTKKSQTQTMLSKHNIALPTIGDFGTQMNVMETFMGTYIEACKSMNKNFVVLAHAKSDYKRDKPSEPPTLISIKPLFTGNNRITAFFDFVWYMEVDGAADQARFRARTGRTQMIEAKTRWGGIFPDRYDNPNYPEIKNALEEYHTTGKIPTVGSLAKK